MVRRWLRRSVRPVEMRTTRRRHVAPAFPTLQLFVPSTGFWIRIHFRKVVSTSTGYRFNILNLYPIQTYSDSETSFSFSIHKKIYGYKFFFESNPNPENKYIQDFTFCLDFFGLDFYFQNLEIHIQSKFTDILIETLNCRYIPLKFIFYSKKNFQTRNDNLDSLFSFFLVPYLIPTSVKKF